MRHGYDPTNRFMYFNAKTVAQVEDGIQQKVAVEILGVLRFEILGENV